MLERLASHLVRAVDAVVRQELEDPDFRERIYIPMIVTNAKLQICHFIAGNVSLLDGMLPGAATFEDTHAVYFRRSLAAADPQKGARTIQQASERTVLVVGGEGIAGFLMQLRLMGTGPFEKLDARISRAGR